MLGSISPRLAALLPGAFALPELRIRTRARDADKSGPGSTENSLRDVYSQLGRLRTALERLEKTGRAATTLTGPGEPAETRSSSALSLSFESAFTTLRSTEQVNTIPTSFTPTDPSYDGPGSTAQPTIGGTYSGAQGDDTLQFLVKDNATVGDDKNLRIDVLDGTGTTIETLNFKNVAPGTPLTLSNGLTLALGAGTVTKNESFFVDVSASVESAVDPTKPFDGTGSNDPNFEPGLSVTADSFEVNGVTINVAADDTINSVLAKITASAAGVTASFDSAAEEIVFTQKTAGAENTIALTNDGSGFFAATKLAGASAYFPKFATLESRTEVNTISTSFTPTDPSYDGPGSTAQPTIGGTYSGAQGDDTLQFLVKSDATVGSNKDLKIDVLDGTGTTIETLNFKNVAPGTPLTLSNGLTLALGAGTVTTNESFFVDVSASVGQDVDPTKPFDGTGSNDPNFEPGLSVTAGSFEVNGVTINVAADDTINSVVGKINSAGAGVTASFDAARDKIVVTQQIAGSFKQVVLENDTSGFLAATKLDDPRSFEGGQGHDSDRLISSVGGLSGISTGNFEINEVSIAVDVATDSLNDVVARINASGADVTASLDTATNLVTIRSNSNTADLVLDDGTSGFFSALNVTPGTIKAPPSGAVSGERLQRPDAFENQLEKFGSELNKIFSESFDGIDEDLLPAIEDMLAGTISDSFAKILGEKADSTLRSRFGIDFDFREASRSTFSYNGSQLDRTLRNELGQLTDFLFRESSDGRKEGLVVSLIETVKELQGLFEDALRPTSGEPTGIVLDLIA